MPFGLPRIFEEAVERVPFVGTLVDDDEPRKKRRRPKPPKPRPRPRPSREYDVPIPPALIPRVRKAAAENRRELIAKARRPPPPPKRRGGFGGLLSDITEGRGALGLATTGPIGLFARNQARNALLKGDISKALSESVEVGRYGEDYVPMYDKKGRIRTMGPSPEGIGGFLHNLGRGINVMPSAFLDLGVGIGTAAAKDVARRRGLLGLATTGPIGMFANEDARNALFRGDFEKSIKETIPDWDAPKSESSAISKSIIVDSIASTKRAFTDPKFWYEDPLNAAFSAAIVLGPASRAAGIARTAAKFRRAGDAKGLEALKVATAENFLPGISGREAGIRREIPTGREGEAMRITASRHPFGRAFQRQYDMLTNRINAEAPVIGPLASPRRARRLEARRQDLGVRRVQRDVNLANRKAALYINEGLIKKGLGVVGDSLRRGRDSAIFVALQAPKSMDEIEAVRLGIEDTRAILDEGWHIAPDADLADLTDVRAGEQQAFYDNQRVTVTDAWDDNGTPKVRATTEAGEEVEGPAARFRLVSDLGERVKIPVNEFSRRRLEQRLNDLTKAWEELQSNPKQAAKFRDAVEYQTRLGELNEYLGESVARATVGTPEWTMFQEGSRIRRNLMARRWRRQGRAAVPESARTVDTPQRTQFVEEVTRRFPDHAEALTGFADRLAQAAAETAEDMGTPFTPEDWWRRLSATTSMRAADFTGEGLFQGGELVRRIDPTGTRRSLLRGDETPLGVALPGTVAKRGPDGTWWWGITDNGDGTVRGWSSGTGWVDDMPINNIRGGNVAGFEEPLHIGEKVHTPNGGTATVSGYNEHPERGPMIETKLPDGSTLEGERHRFERIEGGGQPTIFYSKAQRVIADEKFPERASAGQIRSALEKEGVKAEELVWTGLDQFAETYPGKSIPKADLLDHLENSLNGLDLDETVSSSVSSRFPTKWDSYGEGGGLVIRDATHEEPYYELVMLLPRKAGTVYRSGHFAGENYLFHIRFHEITDAQGRPALLIDELQSDLHAAGRRGGYDRPMPPEIKRQIDILQARVGSVRDAISQLDDIYQTRYALESAKRAHRTRVGRDIDLLDHTYWHKDETIREMEEFAPEFDYRGALETVDRYNRLSTIERRLNNTIGQMAREYQGSVPDFPFKNDAWMQLAMKRLVRWAADRGQERIYWTRGHEHMIRYEKYSDLSTGKQDPPEPDEYFYEGYASASEDFGELVRPEEIGVTQEPIPEIDIAMQSQGYPPMEPRSMRELPPEREVVDLDDFDSDDIGENYGLFNGRFARILSETEEGAEIEYLPAAVDPQRVNIEYNAGTGGDWHTYRVTVDSRVGTRLVDIELEGSITPYNYNDFWEEVAGRYPEGSEGWQAATIMNEVPRGGGMLNDIDRSIEWELDEYAWDEYLSEQGYGDGETDFETLRDFRSQYADPKKSHLYFYDRMLPAATEKALKPFKSKVFFEEEAYTGRYSTEGAGVISEEGVLPAHGIEVTPEMKQSVIDAKQSLFQKQPDFDGLPKGALEFIQGTIDDPQKFAIRLFEDADASTVVHELAHVALYDLHPYDLRIIEEELQGGLRRSDWTDTEHERFSRAFEKYVHDGKAMSPGLERAFAAIAKTIQLIYSTIRDYFSDIPRSAAVDDVFDRMINPRSFDEARTYVPHRSGFDVPTGEFLGGVRLPAGGTTLGRPRVDRRAFPNKPNAEVLWESGEVLPSTAALSSQVVRRAKYRDTLDVRRQLYKEANPIKADQPIPTNAYLVRDPDETLERIPERVRAATSFDEDTFAKLTGDLEIDTWQDFLKSLRRATEVGPGEDMKNVRWIEPWKVESLVRNVFPSAPKGRGAAALGGLNTLSRMSQIYLRPIRYLTGNVPANVVLLALTNPSALPKSMTYMVEAIRNAASEFGKGPASLARINPDLYSAIRAEAGDVMAGAGLPEFYTRANNGFQKGERNLNRWSSELADRLGEVSDQPFRVAAWISHAKRYGYKDPRDWARLLAQPRKSGHWALEDVDPELARIRDEIAQKTREDMIDFNAMTPWERQNISRFFYLWAFTRGFVKWPLTFARDYPERLAGVALAGQATEQERSLPKEWIDARLQSMIERPDGTRLDFSSWNPVSGGVEAWNALTGLAQGNIRPAADYLSPTLGALGEAAFDPTRGEGWAMLGEEAAGAYLPPQAQLAAGKIPGIETPAEKRAKTRPGLRGTINDLIEYERFTTGRWSPSIQARRLKDWDDLKGDYSVSTGGKSPGEVTNAYRAYWRYKEYEQRVKYGIVEREGRDKLSDKEKALVMRRVAAEVYDPPGLASEEQIEKASASDLSQFVEDMDWMWQARTSVMSAATRRRNELAARKQTGVTTG